MKKRLAARIGTYTKNGEEVGKWVTVGALLESDNGPFILLNPAVNLSSLHLFQGRYNHSAGKPFGESVMVSLFDFDDKDSADKAPKGSDDGPF